MRIIPFFSKKHTEQSEQKSDPLPLNSADLYALLAGGNRSVSGVGVNQQVALSYVTVWACVRLLAESIAQLPVHLYRKHTDGTKVRITDHPLSDILSFQPNSWQTAFEYVEFLVSALCLRGNNYAYINRVSGRNGEIIKELIPFAPQSVAITQNSDYSLIYSVSDRGKVEKFPAEKVHHIRGLSLDGFSGVSPITYQRDAIGLGIAAQSHGGYVFKNEARPAGILEHPGTLKEEARKNLKREWEQTYGGSGTAGTAVLWEGLKFHGISMSNEDAQYLETRAFQRAEICSIFRVPPHMIGDLTKSSFSNITQQSLEFVKYTILPWVRRIESAISRDLLTPKERAQGFFAEFMVAGLERADIEQRYRSYNIGINSGILSPNECRMMENRNKRPGGDIYLAPLNMVDSTNGMPSAESQGGEEEQNKGINFNLVPITAGNKASAQDEYLSEHMLARERLRSDFAPRYLVRAKAMVKHEIAEIRQRVASGMPLPHAIVAAYADMPAWIKGQFADLVREYAIKVRDASLLEAGAGALDTFVFSEFIDQLLDGLATGHSYDGHNQLMALINDQLIDDSQAAVEARMEEWAATRADKFAGREPVEHESAISRFVWAAVGVTALKWQTRGNKTCPFCAALNGKIVGIDKPFLEPGAFEPPGHEQSALKVRGPRLHAPIHRGCVCMIVPVTE